MKKARLLLDTKSNLGEGSWYDWREDKLIWLDVFRGLVHKTDPKTYADEVFEVPGIITTIVPDENGGYIASMKDGIYHLDGKFRQVGRAAAPEVDYEDLRYNDGKCDPQGRFWVGTMAWDERPGVGALYCTDGKECRRVFSGTDISNGIAWNAEKGIMYYTDSVKGNIYAYDYAPDGTVTNQRVFYHTPVGITDGMTIDETGDIWSAIWGAGKVVRLDGITGEVKDEIFVDAPHTASVAIGRGVLYITTARHLLSEEKVNQYPLSGGLFGIEVDVSGIEQNRYHPAP